jgi:hypothetical protein
MCCSVGAFRIAATPPDHRHRVLPAALLQGEARRARGQESQIRAFIREVAGTVSAPQCQILLNRTLLSRV